MFYHLPSVMPLFLAGEQTVELFGGPSTRKEDMEAD